LNEQHFLTTVVEVLRDGLRDGLRDERGVFFVDLRDCFFETLATATC